VADQVRDFLENGNVQNAVNFPNVFHVARIALSRGHRQRQRAQHGGADIHRHGASWAQHPQHGQQVQGDMAYTLVDVESAVPQAVIDQIAAIAGVLMVRALPASHR